MAHSLGTRDRAFLERAHELSLAGWGRVHPNPLVGCVIVRGSEIVGEGYHAEYGGPHAEAAALAEARELARGSTAYVTLEPCAHWGKTPPCAEALYQAGVERVVYGAADPGPGRGGGEYLRGLGVKTVGPVWDLGRARAHNPSFFHAHSDRAGEEAPPPFVALKLAMTLDARIASSPGVRTRITGSDAECETHRLRTGFDAVMVGAVTARADDPRLTVRRVPPGRRPPARVVIDSLASLDPDSAMLLGIDEAPVHVVATTRAAPDRVAGIRSAGGHVHLLEPEADGRVPLRAALGRLAEEGMASLLCEGGGVIASGLLAAGLVGRLYIFLAPALMGAEGVAAFPGVVRDQHPRAPHVPGTDPATVACNGGTPLAGRSLRYAEPPRLYGSDTLHIFDVS